MHGRQGVLNESEKNANGRREVRVVEGIGFFRRFGEVMRLVDAVSRRSRVQDAAYRGRRTMTDTPSIRNGRKCVTTSRRAEHNRLEFFIYDPELLSHLPIY